MELNAATPYQQHHNEDTNEKRPTMWQRQTIWEKILLVLYVSIALIVVVLFAHYVSNRHKRSIEDLMQDDVANFEALSTDRSKGLSDFVFPNIEDSSSGYDITITQGCRTPVCIKEMGRTKFPINELVEACEDFFEFAWYWLGIGLPPGKYLKDFPITSDKTIIDTFGIVRGMLQKQIITFINEPLNQNDTKSIRLVKNFNAACMNQSIIEKRGVKPLSDILETFGGWPVVKGDAWSENNWDWVETIKKCRLMGLDTSMIFTFDVVTDWKNSSKRVLRIDQTSLEVLDRSSLIKGLDEKYVKAYYDFMVGSAVVCSADRSRAEKELKEALEFEMKLANISVSKENLRIVTGLYNLFTIKQLQESYPYLPWLKYINTMLPNGLAVDDNEIVLNVVPTFFRHLGEILNTTPKRTIANYLMWRTVLTTSGRLGRELRQYKIRFFAEVKGQLEETIRWKECAAFTVASLPAHVGSLYIRKYFNVESKKAVIEMVENIREELINVLHEVTWMDENTRSEAIKKANALTAHIGYPNELADDNKLEEYYKKLEFESDNLLLNTLRLSKFVFDEKYSKLREPVNKTEWTQHSLVAVVNAFYSPLENSIQVPAGILQDRFFSADRPQYLNYAAIGQFIGHEITHGFDDTGRQFDSNGNLRDWWNAQTEKNFLERAQCIIWQYGNYTEPRTKLSLNGVNTQSENIADNGGVKLAYRAYNRWVSRNQPEEKLYALKYDVQQLFWLSFAQKYCFIARDQYLKNKIMLDAHAPHKFRVNGVVSNMQEFATAFNCPVGSKMNPVNKCEVW